MPDVTTTITDKPAVAIESDYCDECNSKIDFDSKDYIPEDPTRTHHHCGTCGLVDYFPPKAKSNKSYENNFKSWWGNTRERL